MSPIAVRSDLWHDRGEAPASLLSLRRPSAPSLKMDYPVERATFARVLPELAPDEPLPPLDALTAQTRLVEALARAFEALTSVLLVIAVVATVMLARKPRKGESA